MPIGSFELSIYYILVRTVGRVGELYKALPISQVSISIEISNVFLPFNRMCKEAETETS